MEKLRHTIFPEPVVLRICSDGVAVELFYSKDQ
jgi:hypothetical protein